MVIVYVLTSLGMGGAERQVLALAGRMANRGHAVKLLVLRSRLPDEWPCALPVIYLDMHKTPLSVLSGMLRARNFLRGYRPDIVHSHSFHANVAARLLRIVLPLRVVSTVHNVYEGGWARMLAYRITDRLCMRTTAVSMAAAERFTHLKAVPRGQCMVITNGIDEDEFSPSPTRRAQIREAMLVKDEFVWMTAGRIVPAKDFPNLLRAFRMVHALDPAAKLWIAGAGDPADVMREAGSAGEDAMENIRWLGLRRDLPALLNAADGFVLASAWEGMPLVVGEAMAMEKPVAATDVGGVRELLGHAGMLVPPGDPKALADAMTEVMAMSTEDRRQMGHAARRRICAEFSMQARVAQWERLYREVISSKQ
jgi:glycosyltransferase involved in cell wall biosynthesis